MSLTRKIAHNTIVHVAGRILGAFFGIINVGLMTRYLGAEGYGNYTTIFAYLFFFGVLADLGLYMVTVNEIAKKEINQERFLSNVFTLRALSALFTLVIASFLIWLFPYPHLVKVGVAATSLAIFFNLIGQIIISLYQNKLKMYRVALSEVICKIVILLGIIVAIFTKASLLAILIAIVFGHFSSFLINFLGSRKWVKIALRFEFDEWKKILTKSWPVALSSLFVLIYFKADTLFLSLLRPQEIAQTEVGIYGAPYKILEVLITFPSLFMGLIAPLLARSWTDRVKDKFKNIFQKVFDFLSIVIWPMIFGTLVLAGPIMRLIAPGFEDSDKVLMILIFATGIIFLAHLPTYVIVAIGKQRKMIKFYILAAIGAVLGYLLLIPKYSYFAAASVTVGVELFILMAGFIVVLRNTKIKISLKVFLKAFLASLIMAVVLYSLINYNLFLIIIIGSIFYLLILYFLKGFSKELVREILEFRK